MTKIAIRAMQSTLPTTTEKAQRLLSADGFRLWQSFCKLKHKSVGSYTLEAIAQRLGFTVNQLENTLREFVEVGYLIPEKVGEYTDNSYSFYSNCTFVKGDPEAFYAAMKDPTFRRRDYNNIF